MWFENIGVVQASMYDTVTQLQMVKRTNENYIQTFIVGREQSANVLRFVSVEKDWLAMFERQKTKIVSDLSLKRIPGFFFYFYMILSIFVVFIYIQLFYFLFYFKYWKQISSGGWISIFCALKLTYSPCPHAWPVVEKRCISGYCFVNCFDRFCNVNNSVNMK